MYRHGDLIIEQIGEIPKSAKPNKDKILAYGEATGHTHRIDSETAHVFYDGINPSVKYLDLPDMASIVHEEHGPIEFPSGKYKISIQRRFSKVGIYPIVD